MKFLIIRRCEAHNLLTFVLLGPDSLVCQQRFI
jgi:hypothetical protein